MVSSFGVTLLVLCVSAATVAADTPGPCCPPDQFIITVEGTVDTVDNGTFTTDVVHVIKAHDATNRLVTNIVTEHNEETGEREETKIINLYPQGVRYVIRGGKCTKETLTKPLISLCVPDDATFEKTVTIGLSHFSVNQFSLVVPEDGYDLQFRYSVSQDNCIPYFFSLQKFASAAKVMAPSLGREGRTLSQISLFDVVPPVYDTPPGTYIHFTDYIEGIADPAFWFKPPPECKQPPTNQQETGTKKMADRLRALFGNSPKFDGIRP